MHCKTDHLYFSLELNLSTDVTSIFEPFYCYNCSILEITFVDISETSFANNVLAAEVVGGNLKFSKLKTYQVS